MPILYKFEEALHRLIGSGAVFGTEGDWLDCSFWVYTIRLSGVARSQRGCARHRACPGPLDCSLVNPNPSELRAKLGPANSHWGLVLRCRGCRGEQAQTKLPG
jgi:hypothetical protein